MITNERQYRMTKATAERFERAIAAENGPGTEHIHPRLRQAMREGLQSQLDDLRADLAAYEALRSGQVGEISIESLAELPQALIQARIAARLSQKHLAERLGIREQQVQHYEATRYASASFRRIQEVAAVLGVRIVDPVVLQVGTVPVDAQDEAN